MNASAHRNRKRHSGWRACALGAAATAALLATTACEPGEDDAADAPKSSAAADVTSSATATATPPAAGSDASGGSGAGGEDASSTPLCTLQDLSITATNYDGKADPVRHILLVATNKSGKKCDVQNAPEVTLGDAKGPAPVMDGTASGEAVTLAPGDKAYAGLLATGGHMDTYDVTFMTLTLGSPGGETEAEKPITVPMPVASFPADDGQRVTDWAGTEGLAMRPVTLS